jgi:Domain of unknown function (DUF4411)
VAYWLDADTFITAKNSLYAFEVNTTLWAWFDTQLKAKTVRSPERVFREIMAFKKDDLLKQWVSPRKFDGLCIEPDKRVSECLNKIADHLYTATVPHRKTRKLQLRYKPAQAAVFGRGADAFVIAHAMADNGTVVTFESDKCPDSQRIRIPDICDHFGVDCTNLKGLLVALGAKL